MNSRFEWDDDNVGHLARHGSTPAEFEQVFNNPTYEIEYGSCGEMIAGRLSVTRQAAVFGS